ncbi:hypothetical protein I308_105585 [Cryptococcus tetragattii IND107]|uniref:XPG N-terminal domain-containing protein n=1 Tax=Cryptococcus tetragattii IND107 TaxID=1296105 RepID=A0ABR3BNZ8_9TREE
MTIRGLDNYLKERKLIQSCPISTLANTRLGIDATHYLNHLLTDPNSREPLVAATGGLPLAIISKIENDLRALERHAIKPVFVFPGLPLASRPPPKGPDIKAERENQIKNEAWALYDEGQAYAAVDKLVQFNNGNFVDQRDLLRSIMRLFRHRYVEFVVAPYLGIAQDISMPSTPPASVSCGQWRGEQLLDFGILAGSSLSRTIPLPQSEFSIKNIADLVRHHKSGISVCQNVRQEPPYKAQYYTESFWKARLAVKFSLVLTTEGACVPLPTVITPQQQAFTVQDVPGDLEEIFSPRIPDELYFHICRGLVSAQVVGWLTSAMIIEQQPLLETGEYRRFIKDVITEGPTSPRCTTIALLADILHPDWSKRRIVSAHNSACAHCRTFTTTLTLPTLLCSDWMVPMSNLEMELRRQNSSTIDLKLCVAALASEELVHRTFKPKGDRVLDKKDEVVANSLWRFLEEPIYLILELLRAGVLHGGKWGGPEAAPLLGGPSFGDEDEQSSNQQWVGPLSQELLAFNAFVRGLSKSLRQLFEAVSVHLLLSGDGRRNRDDYSDIMLSEYNPSQCFTDMTGLPFQTDVNTGFGILAKSYLDATSYHNQLEPITEEMIGTERAETAKRQAILFIEENFSSVKGPVQELERGFRFWDAVMVAIRCLAEEQGPNPKLAQTVVGKDVIEQFEKADKWLKPMRP